MTTTLMRPSQLQIPVFYPNDDPRTGAGMTQSDFDNGAIGGDDLRTIAEILSMGTFANLAPEFQRRYIAMAWACWIEVGMLFGVGTGQRSETQQAANYAKWPGQFAPVSASLHMRKLPKNWAWAIDTIPYDVLVWAHANCTRFGINFLEHMPNERHHCQPIEFPNSGSAYNARAAELTMKGSVPIDLPNLGRQSLAEWLAADVPVASKYGPWGGVAPVNPPKPPPSQSHWIAIPGADAAKTNPAWLQEVLNQHWWASPALVVDGKLGPKSSAAIKNAQAGLNSAIVQGRITKRALLAVDGVWGQNTAQAAADWVQHLIAIGQ